MELFTRCTICDGIREVYVKDGDRMEKVTCPTCEGDGRTLTHGGYTFAKLAGIELPERPWPRTSGKYHGVMIIEGTLPVLSTTEDTQGGE